MLESGEVQPGPKGLTHVSLPADRASYRGCQKGSIFCHVPSSDRLIATER